MKNLCIASVVFNTSGNRLVLRNMNRFLRQLAAEGLPFHVAEVALGEESWCLDPAPNVVQLRAAADQVLWYQWNLVNILEKHIPAGFDAIAWTIPTSGFSGWSGMRRPVKWWELLRMRLLKIVVP